ncbi:uncharacterized protein F4822DRAFT_48944 [Hypoxylon trugodes]|uniref:uncharacterized protein n=1 Tax=Hypoxylon trugodes TaxID=326681 RepID=UPI0021A23130|nr:uncharacterized protein F4822DRAFT_48944 [Hypoxylon trugodes]KAI1383729.1 hypothetical protein F4822DRAFT_48944 [Hypoxylon trugodes]
MSRQRTSTFGRRDRPVAEKAGYQALSQESSNTTLGFCDRLRSIWKSLFRRKQKSQKSSTAGKGNAPFQEPSYSYGNDTVSTIGQRIIPNPTGNHVEFHYQATAVVDHVNTGRRPDEDEPSHPASTPSVNLQSDNRRLSWLETNPSRTSGRGESLPVAETAHPPVVPIENQDPREDPDQTSEREKTLRILESRDKPSGSRSCSPDTMRRHRRSYQLATDPRIDLQQYIEFQHFLEREIATDLALRLDVWRSLTQELGNRAGLVIHPKTGMKTTGLGTGRPKSGQMQRASRNSYPNAMNLGHETSVRYSDINLTPTRQDNKWKRRNWASSGPNESKSYMPPGGYQTGIPPATGDANPRKRSSTAAHTMHEQSPHLEADEETSWQRRNDARKRQSLPNNIGSSSLNASDRRASISSFTQFFAQYIKPDIPVTTRGDSEGETSETNLQNEVNNE